MTLRAMRLASGIAVLLCTTLAACRSPVPGKDPTPEPRIWDVRAGGFISEPQLVTRLAAARYRLLGEVHDNPAHHVIRARLIAGVAATGERPAVVFEQIDLDHDDAVVAAQAAGADAEKIADAGRLDREAWAWPLHKPVFDAALGAGLPVRAGNMPRERLRGDLQTTIDTDSRAFWYARFHAARWTEAQATAMRADIVEGHCNKLPEAVVPRILLAQRLRDAAMAQALVSDATAAGAILIAGNGHVRADLGVPVYLHAPGLPDADSPSVSVGLLEVTADDARAGDFPREIVAANPGFDYIWFTPPAPREDPCAGLAAAN